MELYLAMRRALADTFVFYYKAHAAHWNVTGDGFPQYHAFLDSLNSELFGAVDPMAEHIRALGGFATESLAGLLSDTTIPEFSMVVTNPTAIFTELLDANEKTIASLNDVVANAGGDQGLLNFISERLDVHAKHGWFLRSVLGR